ncbi:MAG: BCCT family transporter [Clostridiales bacterium]
MGTNEKPKPIKQKLAPWVFFPPLIFILALCIWVVSDPIRAGESLSAMFSFVTNQLGWYFELYIFAVVLICIYLCISPIGKKRFGNEKPEFSTFSWVGMIFTAVAGFGVLTWTSIEWFYYAQAPTWGIEPFSAEALEWASMYPLFHWGPVAFAIATLMGVFFAYQFFCKKIEDVRPSTTCIPVLGEKLARGPLGKIFDALFSIGLLCSVVTCVGVNVPTLFGIISRVFGSEPSFMAQAGVIMGWSVLMSILLFTGLKKGIRFFSDFRVWVGFGILAFLLIFGPTATLLNNFVDSVGMFIQYGSRLILNTDPYAQSGTPQAWTVFYWCWYIVLAIQTGIFFAKVSKGRTVRQLVIGALLAQTIGSWLFFGVFQSFTMDIFVNKSVDIAGILSSSGQGAAIVALWDYFPFAKILYPILMVYGFISMQTLLNGQCYSMAMVTTKELRNDEEPPIWLRIFWSLGIGAIAICLLLIGGIQPAQTVSIVTAIPLTVIIAIMVWGFLKETHKEWIIRPDPPKREDPPANTEVAKEKK